MKQYTHYLKPILGLIVSVLAGLGLASRIPLTGQVVPCTAGDGQPCFSGSGIRGGLFPGFEGIPENISLTELILRVIDFILSVILIVGVLAIILAGVYLIVGMGSDQSKERAKNIVLYVVIGILVILFSRAIVLFFAGLF